MQAPLRIALANTTIEEVVAKLEAIGCQVRCYKVRKRDMATQLILQLNDIQPFSDNFVVHWTALDETWFVYMPRNRSDTWWDWLRIPFEPVLAIIEIFVPPKPYVLTEEERQLARARTHIEESLQADPANAGSGEYDRKWPD